MDLFNWQENCHQKKFFPPSKIPSNGGVDPQDARNACMGGFQSRKAFLNCNPPPAFGLSSVEGEWFSLFR